MLATDLGHVVPAPLFVLLVGIKWKTQLWEHKAKQDYADLPHFIVVVACEQIRVHGFLFLLGVVPNQLRRYELVIEVFFDLTVDDEKTTERCLRVHFVVVLWNARQLKDVVLVLVIEVLQARDEVRVLDAHLVELIVLTYFHGDHYFLEGEYLVMVGHDALDFELFDKF